MYIVTVVFFVVEHSMAVITGLLTMDRMTFVNGSCVVATAPPIFMACWCASSLLIVTTRSIFSRIASLIFETLLFGLTLAALPERIKSGYARRSIVDIVVRDGAWAFALIFGKLRIMLECRSLTYFPSDSSV